MHSHATWQVVLAMLDQDVHSFSPIDTAVTAATLTRKWLQVPTTPGTNVCPCFGHMATGYDAQYYAYLLGEVFATDMFDTRLLADGKPCSETGTFFRTEVLAPGGSRSALDSMRIFLGRKPSARAYLRSRLKRDIELEDEVQLLYKSTLQAPRHEESNVSS